MYSIDDFFNGLNTVESVSETEALQVGHYLEAVQAFARLTYKSLYIIDYQKRSFEYVSENPLFLCGHGAEQVRRLGYDFYLQNVKEEDLRILLHVNRAGFAFFDRLPLAQRKSHSISYDFHLINERKKPVLINHKLTPLFLTDEGKIWKAMCIVALSPNISAGNITVNAQNSSVTWHYDLVSKSWTRRDKIQLSEREKEVLQLYARGLTINGIAQALSIAPDTIKFHRRRLFEKTGTQNITEALAYAVHNKLL